QMMFRHRHWKSDDLDRMLVCMFLGTVIGARLGHCLFYEPDYFLSHPLEILKIWKGGLASHGGAAGVLIIMAWFCHHYRYNFMMLADMMVVPTALVCALIRVGNFMNSEIVGIPTNGSFGVVFTALGEDFPRYPAQLFEAACYFTIFILLSLLFVFWRKRNSGMLFGLFVFSVFLSRFLIEYIKVEQADYLTGSSLTVGQYLSVPFIIAGLAIMLLAHKGRFGKSACPVKLSDTSQTTDKKDK
ncbi:MAG: prolipoprotein diacylglyceryl transferase, partial [Succinatimonas hippei]|nr:prolipoprotein diacylglyceryl transferase [Succinatimonas hippei]